MGNSRLDLFIDWSHGIGKVTRCEPTDNPAARVDIDGVNAIGRITYWESGHCDAEIIQIDSEKLIYQKHWDTLEPADFDSVFALFQQLMA